MAEGISSATSSQSYAGMLQSAAGVNKMSTEEIIKELKKEGTASMKSAQEIADKYGISLAKAQQILAELQNETNNGDDEDTPEGSTVSYQV